MHTARGDGLTGIKRRHRDPSSDDVRKMTTTSGSGRLKDDLESSMWRRRQEFKGRLCMDSKAINLHVYASLSTGGWMTYPPSSSNVSPLNSLESYLLKRLSSRKAHLLEDKQIPIVGVFDEVFSTWMAFEGNTQHRDGVADFKRWRQDFYGDDVMDLTTTSVRSRLKPALEDSTWRRCYKQLGWNTRPLYPSITIEVLGIDFHDDIVTSVEQHMIVAFVRAYETNFHGQTKMRVVIKANIVKEVLLAPNLIGRISDNRKEKLGTSYEEINSPDAFKAVKRSAPLSDKD
ncbi:hypothetical protein Tco_0539295 [Tanacetum coccineum]